MSTRKSNIYLADEAREALIRGVDAVADAVKLTLGASGANAILEAGMAPGHIVTNDGVSIAMQAHLEDPVENMGANLIKEIADRSNKESGDGTTTSTVLAQAILHAGQGVTASPMEIKRSLNECIPLINASLDAQKRDITVDEVGQVATISAEDEKMGALLQEIYQQIGKDGIVELDVSNLPETFYEITEGVRLRGAGFLGAYSTTEPGKAMYKNPLILITKQKINSTDDIEPAMKLVSSRGKSELVIYCDEIDMGVASQLAYTHLSGKFKTLVIKAPTLWKDWITEDFAEITGATVIDPAEGLNLRTLSYANFGTCGKIIVTKDETRVIGIADISTYLEFLEEENTDESKLRLAWLQTKAAILKLGANSETELSYTRLKAEDARNASYQALQEGIVPGGGVALLNAAQELPDTIGGKILKEALLAPFMQIVINAGGNVNHIAGTEQGVDDIELMNKGTGATGFNAKTGMIVDMNEEGIVDPVKVTKAAVKNAISVAGTVLTTSVIVTAPRPDPLVEALKQAIKPANEPAYG